MSLRFKISLLSALISGTILLGFGLASWYLIYRERLAAVDREIRTLAARHPGWWANRGNYQRLTEMLEFTFGEQRKEAVILCIRNHTGRALYRSPHWPADLDPAKIAPLALQGMESEAVRTAAGSDPPQEPSGPPWGPGHGGRGRGWGQGGAAAVTESARFLTAQASGGSWRIGVFGDSQTAILLGINYVEVERQLNQLRDTFLLALPLALLLVAIGGWAIGSRALRPLRVIADTAEQVTARGLDRRIPAVSSDSEVARVVRVLNGMMDRLEKSFQQATRFTADASHELKTPLAIMQGELDQALQLAPAGSTEQQVFGNLLEETHHLKKITRNLLLLAQADSGQLKLSCEEVNLTCLLESAIEDARILAADLELDFDLRIDPDLRAQGDPGLLATAAHNLLGNAVKYNEPRGRVLVQAHHQAGRVRIRIANTGPGISEPDRSRVFERFFRGRQAGDATREGSGLGLSLAREFVRAHGGEIFLEESRSGWTAFRMELPIHQRNQ